MQEKQEQLAQLLQEWKKLYAEALIDMLQPRGDVLEIGFGMGFAADRIQSFQPKSHTIIATSAENAKKWAESHGHVTVLEGGWETLLPRLGQFDAIFFNDEQLKYDIETLNFFFPDYVRQVSSETQVLLDSLEQQMAKVTRQFSDEEVETFCSQLNESQQPQLPQFLRKLKGKGNISASQYEKAMKLLAPEESAPPLVTDEICLFVQECLKKHMRKGSRCTCFLNSQTSKYEDPSFFENIITNPAVDYTETTVTLKMSDQEREALLIRVEKIE